MIQGMGDKTYVKGWLFVEFGKINDIYMKIYDLWVKSIKQNEKFPFNS